MPFPFCFLYELLPILPTEDPSKMYMEESRKVPMRPRKNKLPDGAKQQLAGYAAAQGRARPIGVDGAPGYVIMQRDAYTRQVAKA
jgi:hypothetical protein